MDLHFTPEQQAFRDEVRDELVLSHWFKRLLAIELAFGGTDAALQRFIRLAPARAAA